MFGLDSMMLKPILNGVKNNIKKEGIKFIGIIPNEEGDLNTRAFKEPCKIVPVSFLNLLKGYIKPEADISKIPTATLNSFFNEVEELNNTQTSTPM